MFWIMKFTINYFGFIFLYSSKKSFTFVKSNKGRIS